MGIPQCHFMPCHFFVQIFHHHMSADCRNVNTMFKLIKIINKPKNSSISNKVTCDTNTKK